MTDGRCVYKVQPPMVSSSARTDRFMDSATSLTGEGGREGAVGRPGGEGTAQPALTHARKVVEGMLVGPVVGRGAVSEAVSHEENLERTIVARERWGDECGGEEGEEARDAHGGALVVEWQCLLAPSRVVLV